MDRPLPVLAPDRLFYDDEAWARRINEHYEWRLDETAKYVGRATEWFERAQDLNYFLGFVDQIDPRRKPVRPDPFIPFDIQRKVLDMVDSLVEHGGQGQILKCRDVGMSWLMCAYAAWMFATKPNMRVVFVSRVKEDTDGGESLRPLLPKIRFIINRLPKVWGVSHRSRYMEIMNPDNGASVQGGVGTNAGRGDRSALVFL